MSSLYGHGRWTQSYGTDFVEHFTKFEHKEKAGHSSFENFSKSTTILPKISTFLFVLFIKINRAVGPT